MKAVPTIVYWSTSAQNDLERIVEYISADSIQNARSIYQLIRDHCQKLEEFPQIGRIPPELKEINIDSYRELLVAQWRVLYRITGKEVNILAVIDSRRGIDDALLNRMLNRGAQRAHEFY